VKKSIITAVVICFTITLVLSGIAYAGDAKSNARADFQAGPSMPPRCTGHATINYVEDEEVWKISGEIKGLQPNDELTLQIGTQDPGSTEDFNAGKITTNSQGEANFDFTVVIPDGLGEDYSVVRIVDLEGLSMNRGARGPMGAARGTPDVTPVANPPYEKETNEVADDWTDFIHFLDVLNNTPAINFKTEIEKVFNVDGFLSCLAANTVLSNMDSIAGRQCNFYLYHNMITGKFEFIPWELNMVFGNFLPEDQDADTMLSLDIYDPTSPGTHMLVDRILYEPEYMDTYIERVRTLINGAFSTDAMRSEIDAIYDRIKADVYLDIQKGYNSAEFDESISQDIPNATDPNRILGLKPFVTDRVTNILNQLDQ